MGAIVGVACKSCKAYWQCITGCGMMHGTLQAVADLFPGPVKEEIMRLAGQTKFPLFDFAYKLSCCAHCGSVESVPVIRLPESRKVFIGTCPACGHETKLIRDLSETACPACHETALEEQQAGNWD